MQNVAFIGLGIMGQPMAGHLLQAGCSLRVHSRTQRKAETLISNGAFWRPLPADAARDADVVFICVTDTPDVHDVILGPHGVLSVARPGMIVIDHSTISPAATREMAKALAERGTTLLDAPVSGGDAGARNASLSIMVGGERTAFERVEPLLRHLGKTITFCGPSGTGQLTKAVNQILVGGTLMAVCEALVFALKNGLNAEKTLAAVSGGAAASWQLQNLGPRMLAGDLRPGFMIDLIEKDLKIVVETAAKSGTSLPSTSLAHQLFIAAQSAGHGRDGTQALFTILEKLSNVH